MTTTTITPPFQPKQALFELTLLNAESSDAEFDDVVITALKKDIPAEVITRLAELWTLTKVVAGEVVAIGKIIVGKIIEFILANPKLIIGIAIGAAATALVSAVPLLGPFLASLVAIPFMIYGASVGASMQIGDYSMSPVTGAIELANKFFELLAAIFNGVAEYWTA